MSNTEYGGRDLKAIQSFLLSSIKEPLTDDFTFDEDKLDKTQIETYIKASSKQTSRQRLEIYAQQYWYRLLDSLEDDFTGILAVLGRERFNTLLKVYLKDYPSDSHLLRDLGQYMDEFVQENPSLVEPHLELVYDLARFEWAQVFAFDGEELPSISVGDIEGLDMDSQVFNLQPYVSLLELSYPLDDFKIALKKTKKSSGPAEASSTKRISNQAGYEACLSLPKREKTFLVVHRYENRVFFKRLDKHGYKLLELIAAGNSISVACGELIQAYPNLESNIVELTANVKDWFRTWVRLGWLVSTTKRNSNYL